MTTLLRIPPVSDFDRREDALLDLARMVHRAELQARWAGLDYSRFGLSKDQGEVIAYQAAADVFAAQSSTGRAA